MVVDISHSHCLGGIEKCIEWVPIYRTSMLEPIRCLNLKSLVAYDGVEKRIKLVFD